MALKIETGQTYDRKDGKGICVAKGCKNKQYIYRGKKHDRFCTKHRRQQGKEANPARYHYDLLKNNAKRRGKEFSISFQYFKSFCEETKYLELKGKGAKNLSIDRDNDELGYVEGNLKVLTLAHNTKKKYVRYWADQEDLFSNLANEIKAAGYIEEMEREGDKNKNIALPPYEDAPF